MLHGCRTRAPCEDTGQLRCSPIRTARLNRADLWRAPRHWGQVWLSPCRDLLSRTAESRGFAQLLKRLQYQAARAIFTIEPQFFFFQDPERFAREVGLCGAFPVSSVVERVGDFFPRVEDVLKLTPGQIGRIEDIPQLLAVQAVEPGVIGVEFGAEAGAAVFVPFERRERNAVFGDLGPFRRIPFVPAGRSFVLFPLAADQLS